MNTRLKTLLGILAAVVVIAGVYFFIMEPSDSFNGMASTTAQTATSSLPGAKAGTQPGKGVTHVATGTTITKPGTPATPSVPPTVLWSFHDRSNTRDTSQLYTAVVLSADSNQYDLGTLNGICKTLPDANITVAGEISAIQCLNNGKGEEVGVFKQGTAYVVKQASLVAASAGKPDVHGTFTVIATLK